jgi:PLP dependent protein
LNELDANLRSKIEANLNDVRERIARACEKSGRAISDVTLVAVSKTKPLEMILAASAAGQKVFGENYVQEAGAKRDQLSALSADVRLHFIGSLQTNKIKQIAGKFELVHSVDREKVAAEISKVSVAVGVVQDILLQIHIGEEETKHGVSTDEAPRVIESILKMPNVRLRGLMALPPLVEDEAKARSQFASLRSNLEAWRDQYFPQEAKAAFTELSMGTSSDYEWAILEGATLVRVGTSIFGERSVL